MGLLPHAEQNTMNQFVFIDGRSDRLADAFVTEQRMSQVVPHVKVAGRGIAVFVELRFKTLVGGLAGILDRRQVHQVNAAGLQFHVHGRSVGDDAVDISVDKGAALEIIVV